MDLSLVTAVMVTGKDARRHRFATLAVEAFLAQTYHSKQLLIIGDSPIVSQLPEGPQIRKVQVKPGSSLGALRNRALDEISDGYVLQWDDDDYYHPEYMSYMQQRALQTQPTALLRQLRYSLVTGSGFLCTYDRPTEGIPGAVIYHRHSVRVPYQEIGKHEDSRFLNDNWGTSRQVLDNPGYYYVRFHTGLNTWDEKHIMRHVAGQRDRNLIPSTEWNQVKDAVGRYLLTM